ncbi:MAG TPA: hypothetical protein VJS90_14080 [Pseudomonas sp.]|uniref:hypothetical protein n=1 Tax=Pseudomonas sp. TaxID=306 RepID=UPI002B460B71|nr:hypothetical protein [Pseudomonas sp.]HKS14151.1 hypothetical protein [Pseudomonas sp.]
MSKIHAGAVALSAFLFLAGCDKAEEAQEHREQAQQKMDEAQENVNDAARENAKAAKAQAEADRTRVKEASGPAPQNPELKPVEPAPAPAGAERQ